MVEPESAALGIVLRSSTDVLNSVAARRIVSRTFSSLVRSSAVGTSSQRSSGVGCSGGAVSGRSVARKKRDRRARVPAPLAARTGTTATCRNDSSSHARKSARPVSSRPSRRATSSGLSLPGCHDPPAATTPATFVPAQQHAAVLGCTTRAEAVTCDPRRTVPRRPRTHELADRSTSAASAPRSDVTRASRDESALATSSTAT